MNKSMVTRQKLLVARGNKYLTNNNKNGLLWELGKKVVTNDKKNCFPTTIKKTI